MDDVTQPLAYRAAVFLHDLGGQKAAGKCSRGCGRRASRRRVRILLTMDVVGYGKTASRATYLPGFCRRRATLGV
jgi:hypothetical protein